MNMLLRLGMGAILLLCLAIPATAKASPHAIRYTGYYYGAENDPTHLAAFVEDALRRDPTGRTMLNPAKCKKDSSCATPLNYLESFRAHNPNRELTLETLAAFMRSLVKDCTITGLLQMDRIAFPSGKTDVNGMTRRLNKGECAWVDPETRMPVLAQHCANPIGIRVDLDCVYIDFEAKDEREFAVIWARYNRPTDHCFAYRKTASLFERDSTKAQWIPVPNGCIGVRCDLSADNKVLGRTNVAQGQIPIKSPGRYQIRLSPDELVVLCLKIQLDSGVDSSFGNGVRWKQDYRLVNGALHARVYYEYNEMKKDGLKLNGARGLAFYSSDEKSEKLMVSGYEQ